MIHEWAQELDSNRATARVLFLNYCKAFNFTDHSILVNKLCNLSDHSHDQCVFSDHSHDQYFLTDALRIGYVTLYNNVLFKTKERRWYYHSPWSQKYLQQYTNHILVPKYAKNELKKICFGMALAMILKTQWINTVCATAWKDTSLIKEPLMPCKVANRTWQMVGTDIFEFESQNYLVTADYYSGFFELVDYLSSTKSTSVITHLSLSLLNMAF